MRTVPGQIVLFRACGRKGFSTSRRSLLASSYITNLHSGFNNAHCQALRTGASPAVSPLFVDEALIDLRVSHDLCPAAPSSALLCCSLPCPSLLSLPWPRPALSFPSLCCPALVLPFPVPALALPWSSPAPDLRCPAVPFPACVAQAALLLGVLACISLPFIPFSLPFPPFHAQPEALPPSAFSCHARWRPVAY